MSNVSLKLRQRAEVMAILKKYRDNVSPKGSQLKEDVDNLKKIGNDSLVAKILFEEIMGNYFSDLVRDINILIQKAQ